MGTAGDLADDPRDRCNAWLGAAALMLSALFFVSCKGEDGRNGEVTGFRTKGDANESADSTIVPVGNVYGVARLLVPYAGLPKAWFDNGQTIA